MSDPPIALWASPVVTRLTVYYWLWIGSVETQTRFLRYAAGICFVCGLFAVANIILRYRGMDATITFEEIQNTLARASLASNLIFLDFLCLIARSLYGPFRW